MTRDSQSPIWNRVWSTLQHTHTRSNVISSKWHNSDLKPYLVKLITLMGSRCLTIASNVNLPHSTPTMQYMAYVACLLVFFCRSSYYHDHRCRLHDHHSDQNHHQLNVGYGWGVRCVPKQRSIFPASQAEAGGASRAAADL